MSAARTGDAGSPSARGAPGRARAGPTGRRFAAGDRAHGRELAAVIAHAAGRGDEAVAILRRPRRARRRCRRRSDCRRRSSRPPELLGEVLLELGRPAEAMPFFEQALRRNANRSLSVLGLARAPPPAGNGRRRRHYRRCSRIRPGGRRTSCAARSPRRARGPGAATRCRSWLVALSWSAPCGVALMAGHGPVCRHRKGAVAAQTQQKGPGIPGP